MSKHAADTASTTKKFLAAAGLAFGVASLGLFASAGTAAADGHTIGDPNATWPCDVGPCSSSGRAWGAPDGAEVRETSWVPGVRSIDTSADVLGANTPVSSWSSPPTWGSYPAGGSYPADPSWPGSGWGVADN